MFQRIKDWIINKLGGHSHEDYMEMHSGYKRVVELLDKERKKNEGLSRGADVLKEALHDARATLAGLEILKGKIETFRAEAAVPKMMLSEKELKREIENKKQKAVMSLYSDILSQGRFIVVDVKDKGNKYEITATVSVLEGGVINEGTQLSENAGGAGDSQEGGEAPQND